MPAAGIAVGICATNTRAGITCAGVVVSAGISAGVVIEIVITEAHKNSPFRGRI